MGDRSMKDCIEEQLSHLRVVAAQSTHGSLREWYYEGALIGELIDACADLVTKNDTSYAWGYIEGCADFADVTVSELLDISGLDFDDAREMRALPVPKRKRTRRKRAG